MTDAIATKGVVLEAATARHAGVIANLVQLYAHDLSDVFDLDPGDDGRYAYDKLPLYWTESDRRFAFLLRSGGRLAGFALVTRGSPLSDDPSTCDVAEFFVLRRHRHAGVGRHAAFALWDRFAAPWTVRVAERNAAGCAFWARVVGEYAGGAQDVASRQVESRAWRVFSFDSRNRHGAA